MIAKRLLLSGALVVFSLCAQDLEDDRIGGTPAAEALAPLGLGYKLIGWNDLGMHCLDGRDYSIFAVLPPFNTIHAHLIDPLGKLMKSGSGYIVTYQAVADPLTKSINTTSIGKTNFWQHALQLGFGPLAPDQGLMGNRMPGSKNTPRPMQFDPADNTFVAAGIPITPYPDAGSPVNVNYFPMMRLTARNSSGAVLATTDIVLPVSDEMTCGVCHASGTGTLAAEPKRGWVNASDPAKDVKLNVLRKHDDRFQASPVFQNAALKLGYSASGLETTVKTTPVLCDNCHASNALGKPVVPNIQPLTTAMHGLHARVADPATGTAMEAGSTRDTCYRCHPGPNTKCLRGAMGTLKTGTRAYAIECQNCHGGMSVVAGSARNGWLDEPNCQSCHTGTAVRNNGRIVYTSVFSTGTTMRAAVDQTFATNPDTPGKGLSLYRFSAGHGGLQCESCHGSTHAEYVSAIRNDNVQSTALQGHVGVLAECTACHSSPPATISGGPHGLHPIGQDWVRRHGDAAEDGRAAQCRNCHGLNYRGTLLSKAQANRTFNTEFGVRTFARGQVIGCYNCHDGPNP